VGGGRVEQLEGTFAMAQWRMKTGGEGGGNEFVQTPFRAVSSLPFFWEGGEMALNSEWGAQ
jgi:hypothetical protein